MKDNNWVEEAWEAVIEKVGKISLIIGDRFPSMTENGEYKYCKETWRWVTGFWPGLLWLIHDDTGNEALEKIALNCEEQMYTGLKEYTNLHHDVGFMWLLTAVKRYKKTSDEEARKRGLIAASHLFSRFNLAGRYLVAWNGNGHNNTDNRGISIIDSMMNIPLLYWASEETNDPRFSHVANAHAETVLKYFIRDDGSVNHMVEFDPFTGDMKKIHSGQGHSTTSAWSRGTSWALHGMALAYRDTGNETYLEVARKVADFFVSELPEDYVPHWDFRVERDENTPRDTSAGACAACGLLELARYVEKEDSDRFIDIAQSIVYSLYRNYGNWDNDNEGLLRGGTFNCPAGLGIDVSLIYGDYYYVEALTRLVSENNQVSLP